MSTALLIILLPVLMATLALVIRSSIWLSTLHIVNSIVVLLLSLLLFSDIYSKQIISTDVFIYDSLSGFSLLLVSFMNLLVSFYGQSYFLSREQEEITNALIIKNYYFFLNLFVATMLAVCLLNNIGWVWIAVEGTTLASALLIGLYSQSRYLEAAWKYLIVCTVGILFALLGIVLFATSITDASEAMNIFSLTTLSEINFAFNPSLLKIAFVFIFIGYGTKVGLAPMQAWMPDAYGKSSSPVSALMSSTLSPIVLIHILRFKHITDIALNNEIFTGSLFGFFGILTILFAALFLVNQFDFKRLLAYSSMENMGLIIIAIGISSPLSITAAFLHIIFHSLAKASLFFCTGNIFLKYHATEIEKVRNIIVKLPWTSLALMLGIFSITGIPPMALFTSKFMILRELIPDHLGLVIFLLTASVIIFGSFIHYFNKVLFFKMEFVLEQAELKTRFALSNIVAIVIPLMMIVSLGVFLPGPLVHYLETIAELI